MTFFQHFYVFTTFKLNFNEKKILADIFFKYDNGNKTSRVILAEHVWINKFSHSEQNSLSFKGNFSVEGQGIKDASNMIKICDPDAEFGHES